MKALKELGRILSKRKTGRESWWRKGVGEGIMKAWKELGRIWRKRKTGGEREAIEEVGGSV